MLSVCSVTSASCSSHPLMPFHGGCRHSFPSSKDFKVKRMLSIFCISNHTCLQKVYFRTQATKCFNLSYIGSLEQLAARPTTDFINIPCTSKLDDSHCGILNKWSYPVGSINQQSLVRWRDLRFAESSGAFSVEDKLMDFTGLVTENSNNLGTDKAEALTTLDVVLDDSTPVSNSLVMGSDSLSNQKIKIEEIFGGINESIGASVNRGENAVESLLDTINSSTNSAIKSASNAADSTLSKAFKVVDQTRELVGDGLKSFSINVKEVTSKAGDIAADVLRHTIVAVEDYVTNGASFVVYSFGSAKELLPPEIQSMIDFYEERAVAILKPAVSALQQVYVAVEGLERALGLNPSDPIVPFFLFLGISSTLWVFYRVVRYGGYSGDLSPRLTLDLLIAKKNLVLIDIRTEDLRERDGIPDLRRGARFRYAHITLGQRNDSVGKLLRSGRELDDALLAVVIRNLKIVRDRSEVVVMDADGTRSKGIARFLRKLGIRRPYLVQGGFRCWVRQGLRVKELKPETALTILSEEAEAILEDINPTPPKLIVYGVGFVTAVYAFLEWEKTLQFIGVFGLGQTIFQRVSSYEDSEDFKQDVRLLLAPVRLGVQALSWASGKVKTGRNGLPTSPLSSDVQSRVLQAAAKHESQPPEIEETTAVGGVKSPFPATNEKTHLPDA